MRLESPRPNRRGFSDIRVSNHARKIPLAIRPTSPIIPNNRPKRCHVARSNRNRRTVHTIIPTPKPQTGGAPGIARALRETVRFQSAKPESTRTTASQTRGTDVPRGTFSCGTLSVSATKTLVPANGWPSRNRPVSAQISCLFGSGHVRDTVQTKRVWLPRADVCKTCHVAHWLFATCSSSSERATSPPPVGAEAARSKSRYAGCGKQRSERAPEAGRSGGSGAL